VHFTHILLHTGIVTLVNKNNFSPTNIVASGIVATTLNDLGFSSSRAPDELVRLTNHLLTLKRMVGHP
jgi:hypothetical protein